jgi:hypothetical protein
LNTKSSTEAELVGASDHYSQVVWCAEFLKHQGLTVEVPVIAQDNQSTIALLHKGRAASERTRHIDIRYFFLKDRIDQKVVAIKYVNTLEMVADFMTKPLQGEAFQKLRAILMGQVLSPVLNDIVK